MTTLFYEDQFIQLAPQIRENSLTNDPGKGSPLLVDLDGDNYGDTGIDLDGDGRDDLAIWRPYDSPYGYGWYSGNPQYTFKSGDNSLNGKYYKRVNLSGEQSFSIESINEIAEEHDSQISRQAAYADISQTWGQFISFQGRHYPQSLLNQAGVHWIFIDEGSSLIKFAIDPENFKLYYSSKTELSTVKSNNEPSNISLSQDRFNENILISSTAATLSSTDPDDGDTHTYSLVSGDGDTDNNAFTIVGDELKINASPDYETKNSYSVRLRTTDSGGLSFEKAFTVSVNDLNEDPINLLLSASSFEENIADASTIATLSSTDPDSSDTHTYSLVDGDGDGDADNSAFTIESDQLKIVNSPDYETKDSYSIRLQTKDSGGLTFEKAFNLSVNDLEEGPPDLDEDGFVDDANHYQMWTESGGVDLTTKKGRKLADNSSKIWDAIKAVQIDSGFSILLRGDRKQKGKYRIWRTNESGRLQSQTPWKSEQQMFETGDEDTFETDFNGNGQIGFVAPTGINLSTFSFNENISSGSIVSRLSSTDADPGDTHTYSLVSGSGDTDNNAFKVQGDQLKIHASPDYENKTSYSIRLKTTDSSGGLSYEAPFTMTVNDLYEPVVEDLDGDGFVDGITNYQVLTNNGGVDLIKKKGRKFSDKSSRMWDAVKAITNDATIQVLIEGTGKKNGKFKMWFANPESGMIFSQSKWKNEVWMSSQGFENVFNYDINDNGVVGF